MPARDRIRRAELGLAHLFGREDFVSGRRRTAPPRSWRNRSRSAETALAHALGLQDFVSGRPYTRPAGPRRSRLRNMLRSRRGRWW